MIGVDKKPLKISFWLLLIAAVVPAEMYVYILANATYPGRETVLKIARLLLYYFAPSVLLCIHMKLQQSGKTDFLFPLAFMILLATHTMFFWEDDDKTFGTGASFWYADAFSYILGTGVAVDNSHFGGILQNKKADCFTCDTFYFTGNWYFLPCSSCSRYYYI